MVAEDHDWADSSDSSEDEGDTINLGLMALNDEVDLGSPPREWEFAPRESL